MVFPISLGIRSRPYPAVFSISLTPHCPPLIAEMLMSCLAWKLVSASPLGELRFNWRRGRDGEAHFIQNSHENSPLVPLSRPPRAPRWWRVGFPDTIPGLSLRTWLSTLPVSLTAEVLGGWSVLGGVSCPHPNPGLWVFGDVFSLWLQVGRVVVLFLPMKFAEPHRACSW